MRPGEVDPAPVPNASSGTATRCERSDIAESTEKAVSSHVSARCPMAPQSTGAPTPPEPSSQHRARKRLSGERAAERPSGERSEIAVHGTVTPDQSSVPAPACLFVARELSATLTDHEKLGRSMGRSRSPVIVSPSQHRQLTARARCR